MVEERDSEQANSRDRRQNDARSGTLHLDLDKRLSLGTKYFTPIMSNPTSQPRPLGRRK